MNGRYARRDASLAVLPAFPTRTSPVTSPILRSSPSFQRLYRYHAACHRYWPSSSLTSSQRMVGHWSVGGMHLHPGLGPRERRRMEEEDSDDALLLVEAVMYGEDLDTIQALLAELGKDEVEARDACGKTALHHAVEREPEVFQVILDAMSKEAIQVTIDGSVPWDALHEALMRGKKEAVLAVAERMKREDDWNPFDSYASCSGELRYGVGGTGKLHALCRGPLLSDRQVVDLVAELVPEFEFQRGMESDRDALVYALKSQHDSDYVINVILKRGPTMEERLRCDTYPSMRYVSLAARHTNLAMVRKLHELLPPLDGASRKADADGYATAILEAASGHTQDRLGIMQYLTEHGGIEALELCAGKYLLLTSLKTREEVDWVLSMADHVLARDCQNLDFLRRLLCMPEMAMAFLEAEIAERVDQRRIIEMMSVFSKTPYWEQVLTNHPTGWRWKLPCVHDAVPEVVAGREVEALTEAIEGGMYRDVELLLGIIPREQLGNRNKEGDTAVDVAKRMEGFPVALLARLTLQTKSATS